jgi:RNA polymerase-interacting CarD/CdnL/TRCF family regulator
MRGRLQKHREFIKRLLRLKDNEAERVEHIRRARSGEICTVCEIVKNLLRNPSLRLQLTDSQRRTLKQFRKQLNDLIDRRVPTERKRKILQRGRGFIIPLIASLAGPVLSKLFS